MKHLRYWYWQNVFSKDQIIELNNFIDNNYDSIEDKERGAKYDDGTYKKNTVVKQIIYKKVKSFSYLEDALQRAFYVATYDYGIQNTPINFFDSLLLNCYSENVKAKYDWHIDTAPINCNYEINLTLLMNLSMDNYEGGEFKIFDGEEIHIKEFDTPGTIIMFPSYINHKVTPVTRGERRSLTYFLSSVR